MRAKSKAPVQILANLIRAVMYLRMSSDKQDKSIPAQRAEIERYAKAHGYQIVREYVDHGISGDESLKRLEFNRLIADAQEKKDFEVIIVWDQDRFSRFDPMEANYYWFLLRQAGVGIVTVAHGPLDFAELGGWLSASVNQHGKHQYLRDLSRNVLRGKLAKAMRGKWVHKAAPYGYQIVMDGDLVAAVDGTADVVRRLFERYASMDVSLFDMAAELNGKGLPSPGGKGVPWKTSAVRTILRREIYATGRAMQFTTRKGKFYSVANGEIVAAGGRARTREDTAETMALYVECPPLISTELWEQTQANLKRRRTKTSPRREQTALLTGLMFCGHCGAKMYAMERPRKNGKPADTSDQLYSCSTYHGQGSHGCHRNLIHQAPLLEFLVARIRERMESPETMAKIKADVERLAGRGRRESAGDDKTLEARAAKLDSEIAAAVKELKRTPDDLYDLAVSDLRSLRSERQKTADELSARKGRPLDRQGEAAEVVAKGLAQLARLRERITDANPKVARHALQQIVERIDLWFEHVQGEKITRSVFKKGVIKFSPVFPLVESRWTDRASRNSKETLVFRAGDLGPVQFDHRTAPSVEAAERFLRKFLADGSKGWEEIVAAGKEGAGVSESSLRRAARRLGVKMAGGKWGLGD